MSFYVEFAFITCSCKSNNYGLETYFNERFFDNEEIFQTNNKRKFKMLLQILLGTIHYVSTYKGEGVKNGYFCLFWGLL